MLLRAVDYLANLGGGARFTEELLHAMLQIDSDLQVEIVSYGRAAERYEGFVAKESERHRLRVRRVRPSNAWRARNPGRLWGIKGTARLRSGLGMSRDAYFEVPDEVVRGCDVLWFPWASRHRLTGAADFHVIVTMHDVIYLQLRHIWRSEKISDEYFCQERATVAQWLDSRAQVVVTSNATAEALGHLFGTERNRVNVVPILARHAVANTHGALVSPVPGGLSDFIFCPANISPQKNHEALLEGVAKWGFKRPLVLTGEGSDLAPENQRGHKLRRIAEMDGFEFGRTLIPLGYVDGKTHFQLLRSSRALVMPTLGEGGGSFPVLEAMEAGIPVICSDIPVLREQVQRTGGDVLWFDPHEPADLSEKLSILTESYDFYRGRATEQAAIMNVRSWADVARDYMQLSQGRLRREKTQ